MATANIPEEVAPGNLYAPDDSDIALAVGAMPNGDSILQLTDSGTPRRYYQDAVAGVHYPANAGDPQTICFWIHPHANRTSTTANTALTVAETLMGVADTNAGTTQASNSNTPGFRWAISFTGATNRALTYQCAVNATQRRAHGQITLLANQLQMVTILDHADLNPGNTMKAYVNTTEVPSGGGTQTSGTALGAVTSPVFSIGPPSVITGWDSPSHTTIIGKVAIFQELLTHADVIDLYQAATLA